MKNNGQEAQTEKVPEVVEKSIQVGDTESFKLAFSPDLREITAKADAAFKALGDRNVFVPELYAAAVAAGGQVKARRQALADRIEEKFVGPARVLKQNADELLRFVTGPLDALLEAGRRQTTAYRKAEDDRVKVAQEEAAAKARAEYNAREKARLEAEEKARREEEDRRLEAARIAEESGDAARAAAILDTPTTVAPAPPPPPPPPPAPTAPAAVARTEGEVRKKKRVGRIVDMSALLRAFADNKVPLCDDKGKAVLEVRQSWLNASAKAMGDKVGLYLPGVVCDEEDDTDFKAAK